MKSLLFLLISTLGFLSVHSYSCQNDNMNKLCLSKVVENCYNCQHIEPIKSVLEPACVPVFHNNLRVLENYPTDKWNCTLYRPELNDEIKNEMINFENESELIEDVCIIDNFISEICDHEDKNGFCLIANYIDDICQNDDSDQSTDIETKNYKVTDYLSPWGSKSECITKDYKKICSDSITKSCFDCRTPTLLSYYHLCFPLFASENENTLVTRLKNDKWECKKFSNPRYKPSFQISNHEDLSEKKLYPACTGPICRKDGWTYRANHFGKEWCGNLPCKEYSGNRVLCSFPTNCNSNFPKEKIKKSLSEINEKFHHEFETLGCGSEKFKCLLNRNCRKSVKKLDDCNNDMTCLLNLVMDPSIIQNRQFLNLIQCMIPSIPMPR